MSDSQSCIRVVLDSESFTPTREVENKSLIMLDDGSLWERVTNSEQQDNNGIYAQVGAWVALVPLI